MLIIVIKKTLFIGIYNLVLYNFRDLKLENILLDSKSKDANVKFIDFGLSIGF